MTAGPSNALRIRCNATARLTLAGLPALALVIPGRDENGQPVRVPVVVHGFPITPPALRQ